MVGSFLDPSLNSSNVTIHVEYRRGRSQYMKGGQRVSKELEQIRGGREGENLTLMIFVQIHQSENLVHSLYDTTTVHFNQLLQKKGKIENGRRSRRRTFSAVSSSEGNFTISPVIS